MEDIALLMEPGALKDSLDADIDAQGIVDVASQLVDTEYDDLREAETCLAAAIIMIMDAYRDKIEASWNTFINIAAAVASNNRGTAATCDYFFKAVSGYPEAQEASRLWERFKASAPTLMQRNSCAVDVICRARLLGLGIVD